MILKVFAVYDAKTCFFGNPVFEQTEGSAIRSFSDAVVVKADNNGLYKHPEDYSLWYLADYNNETGLFDVGIPRNLLTASAVHSMSTNGSEVCSPTPR